MLALLWSTWASYLLCSLTYIKIIYIYVREQSKQDAHVHGVHNITSKKLNTSQCGCIQTCDLDHLARLIEFVWIM